MWKLYEYGDVQVIINNGNQLQKRMLVTIILMKIA